MTLPTINGNNFPEILMTSALTMTNGKPNPIQGFNVPDKPPPESATENAKQAAKIAGNNAHKSALRIQENFRQVVRNESGIGRIFNFIT